MDRRFFLKSLGFGLVIAAAPKKLIFDYGKSIRLYNQADVRDTEEMFMLAISERVDSALRNFERSMNFQLYGDSHLYLP